MGTIPKAAFRIKGPFPDADGALFKVLYDFQAFGKVSCVKCLAIALPVTSPTYIVCRFPG